uniref:NADH dehydrogenase subunit 4L n=1 Tax=Arthurdendyus triangulatus TaxID=132421 RepID=UPI002E788EDF|nr:NADH dehydrogenase subunit 4L [Arthurdendyus triangulatus]WPY71422.1 NADH dehydrogenase subunit 4L [Arthurdendyus triangulatus]
MSSIFLMDFFFIVFFLLHFCLLYFYYFRLLKFLISVEISLVLVFLFVGWLVFKYEVTFLLIFLSLVACESSVGLGLLVSFIRFNTKSHVKGNFFSCF